VVRLTFLKIVADLPSLPENSFGMRLLKTSHKPISVPLVWGIDRCTLSDLESKFLRV